MSGYQQERFPIPTPWRLRRELRLRRPPWWMVVSLLVVVVATWIPLALIFQARQTPSKLPPVHFILDMDIQPRSGPQAANPWFRDGRAMRQPVEGTLARGDLQLDDHWYRGYEASKPDDSGQVQIEFYDSMPAQIGSDAQWLPRGRQRYLIYCSVCHGEDGTGSGLVNQRAIASQDPKWVAATNLLTQEIHDRADGQIFQAISDGVRNMPSYDSQISIHDRWAIVAFVRQLQRSNPVHPAATPEPVTQ